MTCIVGIEHPGGVTIGGDSAGVAGWDLNIRRDPKVFERDPYLIGYTSSFRMGQALRYRLDVPAQADGTDDYEHMATVFIDAVRACLKGAGMAKKENEVESGGTFLVAYRAKLYEIDSDYQVGVNVDGYAAVGCGARVALGALHATAGFLYEPFSRLKVALEAAERWSAGVRGPFVSLTQERVLPVITRDEAIRKDDFGRYIHEPGTYRLAEAS